MYMKTLKMKDTFFAKDKKFTFLWKIKKLTCFGVLRRNFVVRHHDKNWDDDEGILRYF
jgi:hypothetical protein